MLKTFVVFGFFSIIIVALTSCSKKLYSSKNIKKQNNETTTASNPSYDTSNAFKGTTIKNVVYKNAENYKGDQVQLALDVYKPAHTEGKKFPVVVLVHGGSFIGGDKSGLASTCSKLANNGYVAISISYRLGWGFVSRAATTCNDSDNLKQAMYRAVQDTHSALRFIAKHADEYNIDKNWIFLGGQSAGAIAALGAAYLKNNNNNSFFPGDYIKKLGTIDKVEDDTTAVYTLKGVISMWGALINLELITNETALPTIFFQGEKDKAVPFTSRPFIPCDNASIVYGTLPLYNRLKDLGVTTIAHVDPQGGHGVFQENFRVENILCFLNDVRQGIKKQVYLTGVQYSCEKK